MVSNKDDRGQQALSTGDISPKNRFYSLELKIKAKGWRSGINILGDLGEVWCYRQQRSLGQGQYLLPVFWVENGYLFPPLRRHPCIGNIPGLFDVYGLAGRPLTLSMFPW